MCFQKFFLFIYIFVKTSILLYTSSCSAAVHELSFAVQSISVSEMLPRTPDLIFVNLTTNEGE